MYIIEYSVQTPPYNLILMFVVVGTDGATATQPSQSCEKETEREDGEYKRCFI